MGQLQRGVAISRRELNGVLADPSLSLAAKGILAFVLTRPAGAVITRAELFWCTRAGTSASGVLGAAISSPNRYARGRR